MKHNWVLIAAILAVLAVPFGLALFEDATRDPVDDGDDTALAEPELAPEPELPEEIPEREADRALPRISRRL